MDGIPHEPDPALPPQDTPTSDPSETSALTNGDAGPATANRTTPSDAEPEQPRAVLCPYCGLAQAKRDRCSNCGGLFEPLSRKATQIAMGPWFIRDGNNPFRPGCSYDVIKKMVDSGKIGVATILRGPTTRQFWSIARNVPGVAHLLGFCHHCGREVPLGKDQCPFCEAPFKEPRQRNELGLQYPDRKAVDAAQRSLDRQLALLQGHDIIGIAPDGTPIEHHPAPQANEPAPPPPEAPAQPGDLLQDVLGLEKTTAEPPKVEDVHAIDFTPSEEARHTSVTAGSARPPAPAAQTASAVYPPPPGPPPAAPPAVTGSAPPLTTPDPNRLTQPGGNSKVLVGVLIAVNVLVGVGVLLYVVFRG